MYLQCRINLKAAYRMYNKNSLSSQSTLRGVHISLLLSLLLYPPHYIIVIIIIIYTASGKLAGYKSPGIYYYYCYWGASPSSLRYLYTYTSRRLNNRSAGINQQSSETLATNQKVIPGGHQVYSYTARFFPWNSTASRAGLEMKPKTWFLRCVDTIVIGEIIAPCNTWIELISRVTTTVGGG